MRPIPIRRPVHPLSARLARRPLPGFAILLCGLALCLPAVGATAQTAPPAQKKIDVPAGSTTAPAAPAEPKPAPTPPGAPFSATIANLEALKGRLVDLERERLSLREEAVFTNAELFVVLTQSSGPLPPWISAVRVELDGHEVSARSLTPALLELLQEAGFLPLSRNVVSMGRHQLRLVAEGTGKNGAPKRAEAIVAIDKGAGGLWADLHLLGDAEEGQPLPLAIDQWGLLSPAVSKSKNAWPYWSGELAARSGEPLDALRWYALAQQRGLPQAELVSLQFRMADAYLAAGMPNHVVALITPYTRQEGVREALEGWFYLEKAAYESQRYRDAVNAFNRVTPKLRVSLYHEALYLAGNSFLQLKEFERAFTTLNQIPRYSEFYPFAQYSMGLAYLNFGDVYSAVESFRRLAALDAQGNRTFQQLINKAHLTVGYEFLHQKRYADAIGQFGQVPPTSPLFDQALFGIGWGYFKQEEFVKAAVVFKDLRQRFPNSPYSQEALVALGYAYSRLQAFKLSIDQFRLALDSVTTQAQALQQQIDAIAQPNWIPPVAIDRYPVVSGLSSQVQLDDLLNHFKEEETLQRALEQYQALTRAITLIDGGLLDLSQMAQSQSQWLSGQENKQRFTALRAGFEEMKKQATGLQTAFKKELGQASSQWLQQSQIRLEEASVQASIGIARNLVLDTAGLQEGM
ncbi:MAG: tetratricopeptide repeat protein [Nitrospirae bacterium]|nr:tetratricopeptide repeat protein [Nitrospirota bacterium]